jgi:hypothetical protein
MALAASCSLTVGVRAAEPALEAFSSGAGGWQGSVTLGPGSWTFTDSVARVNFDAIPIPVFMEGILSNTATATGGAFTGSWAAAGIASVGFRFRAPSALPSGLVILTWGGSTSVYQYGFAVPATGVWYRMTAPVGPADAEQWTPIAGSLDDYPAARADVRFVSIRVIRSGLSARSYEIDDLHLARAAEAAPPAPLGPELWRTDWSDLLAGLDYRLEFAPAVTGWWSGVVSFTATGTTAALSATGSTAQGFWRLVQP